jgi:flagellin FlaB
MKANRKFLSDNHAQAGIGTLIIFIAMVLVAAVAAAVLISTSGLLQQKAQKTGTSAIAETSSNILVASVVGDGIGTDTNLTDINVTIKPAAGAGPIDLSKLQVSLTDGQAINDSIKPTIGFIRGTGPSVMQAGDLVTLTIKPTGTINFSTRAYYRIVLTPESGTPVVIEGTTPATFSGNKVVTLI